MLHILVNILSAFALLTLCCASFYGYGSFIIRLAGFKTEHISGIWIYLLALGFGVSAHLVFLAGSLGLLYFWLAWIIVTVGAVFAGVEFYLRRQFYLGFLGNGWNTIRHLRPSWFEASLGILILFALAYPLLANALLPPTGWDEVAYHLAVPKIYIRAHTLVYIPYIPHSNWPMESEAISTLSLLLGSESLAQLFSWLEEGLICLSLVLFCRKHFNLTVGLLAAAIFASTPMVTSLAGTTMVELPMTFFSLLASLAMLEWATNRDKRFWILSAILGGITASVKLNAAASPILLGVGFFFISKFYHRESWRNSFFQFTMYGLIALAIVSPWYIKSYLQTGNPFWPFLYNLLGGQNWDQLGVDLFEGFIREPNMPINLANWLTGLWQLTWEPLRFGSVFLGWLYLALIPFGIAGIYLIKDQTQKRLLGWIGLLALAGYTTWFLLTHQTRFLMPAAAIMALFLGVSFSWMARPKRFWSITLVQIGLVVVLASFAWIFRQEFRNRVQANLPYLVGQVNRNQYLKDRIQGYPAFNYVNKELPKESRVWLALWESRGYYLDRDYLWANPVNQRLIKLEQIQDVDQLKQALQAHGVTHILYSTVLVDRLAYIPYSTEWITLVSQLIHQNGRLLYQTTSADVYEMLP